MPEVFVDDIDAEDTATASTEAVDGDISRDSMGASVVSHFRDVFIKRGRREVDLVVAKKLRSGFQCPSLSWSSNETTSIITPPWSKSWTT